MGRQRPATVTRAVRVQLALVLVTGLTTALTVIRRDALIGTWAARQSADLDPPSFVPVAIVLFGTFALLVGVLLMLFRGGHPAARAALVGLAVFFLFTMFVMVRQRPPAEFVVLAVGSGLLDLVLLYLLLHRDTNTFLRGAELASERES